jgi:hypothetical protein
MRGSAKGPNNMLLKRTLNVALLLVLVTGTVAFGLARSETVARQDDPDAEAKIENAMRAAPSSVSGKATIVDYEMDDAGKFVVLRDGSNGWSCFPDYPGSPSDDPQCLDQTWMAWMEAYMVNEEPNTKVPGLAYMLQGGTDASNTDPFATAPAAGEEWVTSPPHIMIIMPEALDQTVFSTDHHSGEPWIMWAGTPYEHIMMPVAAAEPEE